MGMSGINGPNGPQQVNTSNNGSQNVQQQVEQYKNSIFEQCDTDKSGKLDVKNKDGVNEVKTFKEKVESFIQRITGGVSGDQAVEEFTNIDSSQGPQPEFDASNNLQTDVIQNEDGSKDIKAGDETVHVSKDGDSISVKSDSGRAVSLVKTPDGGFEFKDEDGKVHKFDKDMNPAA